MRCILRVTWKDKGTNNLVLRKAGTEPFLLVSQGKKALLLRSCAMERRKLNAGRERNNARYYFWSKKKRKTKNTLAG